MTRFSQATSPEHFDIKYHFSDAQISRKCTLFETCFYFCSKLPRDLPLQSMVLNLQFSGELQVQSVYNLVPLGKPTVEYLSILEYLWFVPCSQILKTFLTFI